MMPSRLIVQVQALERETSADKAAKLERCKLGGATDIKPETRKDLATRAKFEDVGLNPASASKWQLGGKLGGGGGTDMSAEHRALPDTQQKFEDVASTRPPRPSGSSPARCAAACPRATTTSQTIHKASL